MKTDDDSRQIRTITLDQSSEIDMHISEARALMYLLGQAVQKTPYGITDDPDRDEQDGICGLVRRVGEGLSETFKSAMKGSPPENAPESILAGGGVITAPPRGNAFPRDLQRACKAGTAIRTEGSEQ